MYYFVRANGETLHNNPRRTEAFVAGEPPEYPQTYFNGLSFCFRENIVRIGWPDTGDLRTRDRKGALARAYSLQTVPEHVKGYLETFRSIRPGSVVLVPNKDATGDIYIAQVTSGYDYYHSVPTHPYEHAHRVGVRWDRDQRNQPIIYHASLLGIPIRGGFWTRAFAVIDRNANAQEIIGRIEAARQNAGVA